MRPLFIHYPKCSTCQRAEKWLQEHHIDYSSRDIVIDNPKDEELARWIISSRRPISKFFNSSGLRYRALNLKQVVNIAPEQELISILSSEGMLVKRPILITDTAVLVGFKESEWCEILLDK